MTKPASLLHCYWDSIDRIFQESCLKLQNLFGGNGEWIAGQRAKVKEERLKAAAATEQESLAAKKAKTVKKEGTVKKPRGRPPKKLDQTSAAMILVSHIGLCFVDGPNLFLEVHGRLYQQLPKPKACG